MVDQPQTERDKINILKAGGNYGWPTFGYGRDNDGSPMLPVGEGIEPAWITWNPGITPSGLLFYTGDKFPGWKGNIFVGSIQRGRVPGSGGLERVVFNDQLWELRRETMLQDFHQRVRDVRQGPDGLLYVGTGDAGRGDAAQDTSSLAGKILRITPDGRPAPGNPFGDSPVWSYGHRNVQGLAWDAGGQLYATEFGQNRYDELNRIEPGANYGWPDVEGMGDDPAFVNPVATWSTSDASPSGLAILDGQAYLACLRGTKLYRVGLDGTGAQALLSDEYGRLRAAVLAPDGTLWVLTSNRDGRGSPTDTDDRILRLDLSRL